jgi:hypothetical protein
VPAVITNLLLPRHQHAKTLAFAGSPSYAAGFLTAWGLAKLPAEAAEMTIGGFLLVLLILALLAIQKLQLQRKLHVFLPSANSKHVAEGLESTFCFFNRIIFYHAGQPQRLPPP